MRREERHAAVKTACAIRYRRRAEARENPAEWEGGPPLEEAFEEAVDLINYLNEARRNGSDVGQLLALAWPLALRIHAELHP